MHSHNILKRPSISTDIPSYAVARVTRIRDLLGKAIGQVRKRNSSKSPLAFKRFSDQSSQAESIQQILANLKKGYLMNKHSQGSKSKIKFVYLSKDQRFLCWKSVDKQDEKRLEITSIEKVIKEGAQFHLTANTIKDIRSCIVIMSADKKLQFQASRQLDCQYFRYQLSRVVKYWRGMSLNYKYNMNY